MMDQKVIDYLLVSVATNLVEQAAEAVRSRDGELMHGLEVEHGHGQVVLEWVKKLLPNASVELKVAALLHDIDRLVTPGVAGGFKGDRNSAEYEAHKKAHAQRSAAYVVTKLTEHDVSRKTVERISYLITHYDDTGNEVARLNDVELNALVAADSFAFFTSFAQKILQDEGEERLRDKVRFMVQKMPPEARELLRQHKLNDPHFEALKNEVIEKL